MNTIKRNVYVLRNTIKIPIEVTKGTDMVGIEFTVRDFDIPATAAAVAYSYNRKMKKQNSQLCDVKGNVISFTPGREFFEVGMNELQIRVINEDKALISFKEKVKCSDAMGFQDDEEEKQQTLIEQLVSNSGKETGERKKADETERNERTAAIEKEKSERTQADATEKSERKAEIDVERKRIDNLAKLPAGSTTGDAELTDIRVGADGTTYDTAGEAVRQQVGSLKEDLTYLCNYETYNYLRNYRSVHTWTHNGITFALQDDGSYDVSGTAAEDALFNFVINTENMPDWIKEGEWLKIKNSSKIVNLVLWYYDENMKYISGPDISGNYYSKVPDNAKSVILRLKVKKGETVSENVKVAIFRNIEGRRLMASSDNAVLMEDVKDMIHINKVAGQGMLKIGNSNIFEITEENKTGNGVTYEYDSTIGDIKVSSSRATADGTETVFVTQKSGSVPCHFAFKAPKKMWLTFQSNPNEWMSFDSGVMYQIYRNGKMIGYERGLGYSFLANKGDEYGFRIIVTKGWSGNIIFKPQLNIGKEALDYEVCCTKTYKEDTVPDDISVGNMVSIINTECTYELAYETKEVKEKKDTKRKGMISFIDDDTTSCKYVKDYHDIFEGTGVCGTYAVMTRRMTDGGTDPEDSSYHYRYDDEGELLELLKTYEMEGFGMVLHCYWQNDTHESTRYFNVATRDIQKCRENMLRGLREYRELGFQNADLWVTPYGVQDTEIQNLAKELGLECLISMSNNTIISEDYRNRWCIPRYSISTTSDQDYLKEQMRTAVEKGGWINIVTHANSWKSADYEMMKNKVREIIAYAKEIGLEIGTFGQCYNEWKETLYAVEKNEELQIQKNINVSESNTKKYPMKKKYIAFGDSLTYGMLWNTNSNGKAVLTRAETGSRIPDRIANAVNCSEYTNCGVGGMGYVITTEDNPDTILTHIKKQNITDCNLITVMAGRNDGLAALGTRASVAADGTICGAIREIIEYIRFQNKSCQIVIIQVTPYTSANKPFTATSTSGWSLNDFDSEVSALCKDMNVGYASWYGCSLLNSWSELSGGGGNYAHMKEASDYEQMGNFIAGQVSKFFLN